MTNRTSPAQTGGSLFPGSPLALFLAAAFLLALLSGCSTVAVRPVSVAKRYDALDRTALNSSQLSNRTMAFFKQRDMEEQLQADPDGLIVRLDEKYHADPGPGTLFALMELAHLQARRHDNEPDRAAALDLSCALYSYLFLFDKRVVPAEDTLRPYVKLASEFHNRSLSRYLLHARAKGIRFSPGARLPLAVGELELKERQSGLPFDPEEFTTYHLAFEYSVSGLDVTYAVPGLGVPLIAVRTPGQDTESADNRPEDRFLSRIRQVLAATLFLRIETTPLQEASGARVYSSRLELYDPMRVNTVQVNGITVPLETDTTTPLAWMAAHAPSPQGIKGLMDPEALKASQGLYMLQPYQKDKIPVVFVHGLISSPMTWLPMINGLMGDPRLRERYQFWYFSYPTGNPVFYSASVLRQSLLSVRALYDPRGENPNFNNMLIVGHSMGGLLTKAMVQSSGNALWDTFCTVPPSQVPVSQDVRELMDRVFFFEPLPFVTEAVFISTPHRGSQMALDTVGRIGRALVTLPLTLARAGTSLLATLAKLGQKTPMTVMPTGIDSLSPKNAILTQSARLPVAVPFHSIIGDEAKAGAIGGTDGVVPYWSSHLDAAVSELIVKSGHGAHEHPLAIREVRRIMLEHLDEKGAVVP